MATGPDAGKRTSEHATLLPFDIGFGDVRDHDRNVSPLADPIDDQQLRGSNNGLWRRANNDGEDWPFKSMESSRSNIEYSQEQDRGDDSERLESVEKTKRPLNSGPRRSQNSLRWWAPEAISCLVAIASFFGIFGVLWHFDEQLQPNWHYNITVNSIISWLSTLLKAALLVSVAACISQTSWIMFRLRPRPLHDIVAHDLASRGPLGSVQLLWSSKAR